METVRVTGGTSLNFRVVQWLLLGCLFVVLYRGVLPQWGMELWTDPNYSHGLLIPFISVYLFRERLLSMAETDTMRQSCWAGLLIVLAALVMLIVGYIGAEFFTKRTSLIVLLFGSLCFLEGRSLPKCTRLPPRLRKGRRIRLAGWSCKREATSRLPIIGFKGGAG